jgi:hypothetical protein
MKIEWNEKGKVNSMFNLKCKYKYSQEKIKIKMVEEKYIMERNGKYFPKVKVENSFLLSIFWLRKNSIF